RTYQPLDEQTSCEPPIFRLANISHANDRAQRPHSRADTGSLPPDSVSGVAAGMSRTAGLRVVRAQAVRERRNALQVLRMTIVSAPEELRDQVRHLSRRPGIDTAPTRPPSWR